MNNFKEYKVRASQASKIMSGSIGLTDSQKRKLSDHLKRKNGFEADEVDANGKPWKALTSNMEEEMNQLLEVQENPTLPKTLKSEIKKIWRSEKYNRNFTFINKFTVKGLMQEEEAITVYQMWLKETKGINRLFTKNIERNFNDYFQGEHDIEPYKTDEIRCGVDIKCSWSLETFPMEEDELIDAYVCQNNVYMDLNNCEKWITAYILVNATEQLLHNEKQKYYKLYPNAVDNPDDPYYEELMKRLKEVDRQMIYDYDRFVEQYGDFTLDYTREEWMSLNLDIPLEDRVIEKVCNRDEQLLSALRERVEIVREEMVKLNK